MLLGYPILDQHYIHIAVHHYNHCLLTTWCRCFGGWALANLPGNVACQHQECTYVFGMSRGCCRVHGQSMASWRDPEIGPEFSILPGKQGVLPYVFYDSLCVTSLCFTGRNRCEKRQQLTYSPGRSMWTTRFTWLSYTKNTCVIKILITFSCVNEVALGLVC